MGETRNVPVRCSAVINRSGKRCRSITRFPNAFCGCHQHLTNVPAFTWVRVVESARVQASQLEDEELDFHLRTCREYQQFCDAVLTNDEEEDELE